MGQINCKSRRFRKKDRDDNSLLGHDVVYEYNTTLIEELGVISRIKKLLNDETDSVEYMEALELLDRLTGRRTALEDLVLPHEVETKFTSFSPGTYSFEMKSSDPRDARPSFVTTLPQLFHSNTRLVSLSLTTSNNGPSSKCVIVESPKENMLRLLRMTCRIYSDIAALCDESSQMGRMVLFDFRCAGIKVELEPDLFLVRLLIHHLLNTFQSTVVDGIPFIEVPLSELRPGMDTKFRPLNSWLDRCFSRTFREMHWEFTRLMTIAFKIKRTCSTVFVFAGTNEGVRLQEVNDLLKLVSGISDGTDGTAVTILGGNNLDGLATLLMQGCTYEMTNVEFSRSKSNDEAIPSQLSSLTITRM